MRLTRQARPSERPRLNMASMIDVVFLLLIFFMCTSSFSRPEKVLPTPLPRAGGPPADEAEPLEPVRIVVSPRPGGAAGFRCDDQPCRDIEHLAEMLAARAAVGDPPVIIAGAADVCFEAMVAALDACHRAGLRRVAFSAGETAP